MVKEKFEMLSFCGNYVRKSASDHFFCALFMPPLLREQYFRLLAFYIEVTRAVALSSSWSVAGGMAGYIRLQWWRDILNGQKNRMHEIAPFIQESLAEGFFLKEELLGIVTAREEELDGIRDWDHWHSVMKGSIGQVQQILARFFGIEKQSVREALIAVGIACETVYMARALPVILRTGRCPLPETIVTRYHLVRSEAGIQIKTAVLNALRENLRDRALVYFQDGKETASLRYDQTPILLPAVLAKRDLMVFSSWDRLSGKRGLGDRLAVMKARFLGKVSLEGFGND